MSRKSTPDILDKKIPRNPKYDNVQPTIDTGSSMPKYLAKMEASGELFKRVKVKMLANMLLREMELLPHVATSTLSPSPSVSNSISTTTTSTQSTMAGTTLNPGNDFEQSIAPPVTPGQSSFLLLDVRDPEEYESARIKGAISYPAAILSRAINYFTSDLYYYKNKENKMILIYDEDEKIAVQAGNTFYQKGIDNIFVLDGGMREFYEQFPDLVVGVLPPKPGSASGSRKLSSRDSDRASTTSMSSRTTTRSTSSRLSTASKKTSTSSSDSKPWK